MVDRIPVRTALLSVYDKSGLAEFAQQLRKHGIVIYASGGTYSHLRQSGVPVHCLDQLTSFTELLDGRVKTLHPSIHAGILARRDLQEHQQQLKQYNVPFFDLVVVNFYPFTLHTSSPLDQAIEWIDIGGPAMVRAAAKNYQWVTVITALDQYPLVIEALNQGSGTVPLSLRRQLAQAAFTRTAAYDASIAQRFAEQDSDNLIAQPLFLDPSTIYPLRYGENPHQQAAFFSRSSPTWELLHGAPLSYNNLLDIDAAIRLILEFERPTVAIIKHTTPCGVGSAETVIAAYEKAFETDRSSPFGGIVISNHPIDSDAAQRLNEIFLEVIIATDFSESALTLLKQKKRRRLLRWNPEQAQKQLEKERQVRTILGGYLVQTPDQPERTLSSEWVVVTHRSPTDEEWTALRFGWSVVKHVRSNAIVFARSDRTMAIGTGQTSRVDAVRCAIAKAQQQNHSLQGTILASDAFFPFPDSIEIAATAGATAIIQPGGSIRDEEVIETANRYQLAMIFTGLRHFRH